MWVQRGGHVPSPCPKFAGDAAELTKQLHASNAVSWLREVKDLSKKAVIFGGSDVELGVIYIFPSWGAKENQNPPNHRVQ